MDKKYGIAALCIVAVTALGVMAYTVGAMKGKAISGNDASMIITAVAQIASTAVGGIGGLVTGLAIRNKAPKPK